MLGLMACSKDDIARSDLSSAVIQLADSAKSLNFSDGAGEKIISFKVSGSWTASLINTRADDWCSIASTSGPAGAATLKITVAPNNTPDERSAAIRITAGSETATIVATQKQKNALTVTQTRFDVGAEGGEIMVKVAHNVDVEYTIEESATAWIHCATSANMRADENAYAFAIDASATNEKREGRITFRGNGLTEIVTVYQGDGGIVVSSNYVNLSAVAQTFAVEVNYKSNGVTWKLSDTNQSWLTHVDSLAMSTNTYVFAVTEKQWYDRERVVSIIFRDKTGREEVVTVTQDPNEESYVLEREALIAFYRALDGDHWTHNENWCSDKPIEEWYGIHFNYGHPTIIYLPDNNLNGTLPPELANLHLTQIYWPNNQISGTVPEAVQQTTWWKDLWSWMCFGTQLDISTAVIPAPEFSARAIDGTLIDNSIYVQNKYTILYRWAHWCPFSADFTPKLVELYKRYRNHGLSVFGYTTNDDGTLQEAQDFINRYNMFWPNEFCDFSDREHDMPLNVCYVPAVNVVDANGRIVFNCISDDRNDLEAFLEQHLGEGDVSERYVSTDFSMDQTCMSIQGVTEGNGINIVLMGDGFSDRQIADGTYDNLMMQAYEALFAEEPYKSFKDLFTVKVVYAVSKNEGYYTDSNTVFEGYFGEGTACGGNDAICFRYALNAVSEEEMDNTLIVVLMNSVNESGTCYMYYPEQTDDYGCGAAVAYFPAMRSAESLTRILNHEACGHGFAKLADEYAYRYNGTIPAEEARKVAEWQANWGWYKNVDFTADPATIRWSTFLKDPRYANEGLGVNEGGYTYWSGVWRPTENSIMNDNTGGFNAPSREAIYYRIHKLAYGDSWQYDYEDFVKYDEINRKKAAAAAAGGRIYRQADYKPMRPPVVVKKTWRDAK